MGGWSLTRRGRSSRSRPQRLARRRADTHGFDRGGARRPFFRSRYFRPIIAITLGIILAGLTAGTILVTVGGGSPSDRDGGGDTVSATVRRLTGSDVDTGAVTGKPQYDAPPPFTLDTSKDYVAVMELDEGQVRIELFDDGAPLHVNNFLFLVNEGFYDGLSFHRVVSDFVAQAGDPTATTNSDAGYVLPDEELGGSAAALSLGGTGIVAMARSGRGASSSQFFITLTPQPRLDPQGFTAFGRIVEGMDLVLALPERDPTEIPSPASGARIRSIRIEEVEEGATAGSAEADTASTAGGGEDENESAAE